MEAVTQNTAKRMIPMPASSYEVDGRHATSPSKTATARKTHRFRGHAHRLHYQLARLDDIYYDSLSLFFYLSRSSDTTSQSFQFYIHLFGFSTTHLRLRKKMGCFNNNCRTPYRPRTSECGLLCTMFFTAEHVWRTVPVDTFLSSSKNM